MPDLAPWNPWWRDGRVPPSLLGTPRLLTEEILRLETLRHIKAVVGVRRAGKTTTLLQVADRLIAQGTPTENIVLLNFDAPDMSDASFEEIERTLAVEAPQATHLILDEVQQKPGWERWVRALYDQRRFERLYVTGSSAHLLVGDLGRLLTGRYLSFPGHPFAFREWWGHRHATPFEAEPRPTRQAALLQYLDTGGFPEAAEAEREARAAVLVDLFHGIVERDVASRHGLEGSTALRLARAFLRDSGTPYSVRRIAEALNVSVERAQRHLDYFIEAGILNRLELFSHKRSPGLRRIAKVYCVDTGLLSAVVPRTSTERGRLLETAVANALITLPWRDHSVAYFQDQGGIECDFVLHRAGQVSHVIQVSADVRDASTFDREMRGLDRAARALGGPRRLLVALDGPEDRAEDDVQVTRAEEFLYDPLAHLT